MFADMIRHHIRRTILWVLTAIVGLAIVPIIQQNVQRLAADKHWDEFLSTQYAPLDANMGAITQYWWFWLTLGCAAGGASVGWVIDLLARRPAQLVAAPTAKCAEISLRFHGEHQIPTEIKSKNIPYWCAIYSPSARLTTEDQSQKLLYIPPHWAIFALFEMETEYKQVVTKFYNESGGDQPIIQVHQQSRKHFALSIAGDITFGELDIHVQQ
jgi:hypothetical protein